MPVGHVKYLLHLKQQGFEPKVIYDIGSCVLHWTKVVKRIWPDARVVLFDAFQPAEFLYHGYDYHIGVLSDKNDAIVRFYQNDYMPGGNSYYRELAFDNGLYFPEDKFIELKTKTLDTIVKEKNFPLPDLVKLDVQGAEVDIIKGGLKALGNADMLIVELQHVQYNQGALLNEESIKILSELGWECKDRLFQNNGADGDYSFVKRLDKL